MSAADPGRGPEYPEPVTMSDVDLATEWADVQEQDSLLARVDFLLGDIAKTAVEAALLGLPADIRRYFDMARVHVTPEWTTAGSAVANRFVDLDAERLARPARQVPA